MFTKINVDVYKKHVSRMYLSYAQIACIRLPADTIRVTYFCYLDI